MQVLEHRLVPILYGSLGGRVSGRDPFAILTAGPTLLPRRNFSLAKGKTAGLAICFAWSRHHHGGDDSVTITSEAFGGAAVSEGPGTPFAATGGSSDRFFRTNTSTGRASGTEPTQKTEWRRQSAGEVKGRGVGPARHQTKNPRFRWG